MKEKGRQGDQEKGGLAWWQLALLGVASTVGTGFFLGSAIGLKAAGPAFLAGLLLASFATYNVFESLAKMTAQRPEKGSFRTYAKQAFGRWAGFSSGWVYWLSEILIMGSQLTAISMFARFWLPNLPLWMCATAFAVLALLIIFLGNRGFDTTENILSVAKLAATVMFIIIAAAAWMGWLHGERPKGGLEAYRNWLPGGWIGAWSSLIFAFYAFGGIEVMGMMAFRMKQPKDAPKAGKVMLLLLTVLYGLTIGLVLSLIAPNKLNPKESPLITALSQFHLPFIPHVFNAVLIIAGFSTMVASLYAVVTMLVTLSEEHDAPAVFSRTAMKDRPMYALGMSAIGLAASIVLSLLIPGTIYETITIAAGLLLLYNWVFILLSAGRVLKEGSKGRIKRMTGLAFIVLAVFGTMARGPGRPGFWGSLGFLALIALVAWFMQRKVWSKQQAGGQS